MQVVKGESRQILLNQQQEMSDVLVRRIENSINTRKEVLEKLANHLSDGYQLRPNNLIQKELDSHIGLHSLFNGGLLVLDANAISIVDSPVVEGRSGINFSDRGHVKAVRKSGATFITKPRIGRGLKVPVFAINTPIKSKSGKIIGFLLGVTRLSSYNLFQKITEEFLGKQTHFMVIDPNLRIFVTASNYKLSLQKLPTAGKNPVIDKVLSGITSGFLRNIQGELILFSASKVNLMDLQVIYTLPESILQANDRSIHIKLALLISGFTLLIALAVWFFLHRQLVVLSSTSDLIGDMVEGKRPYQELCVNTDDEIGHLITSFNLLQMKLSENIESLEKANENLEERIEQRTGEMKSAMLEAERSNRAKSEFLSNMSHELRTPLNAILGFSQMLELDAKTLNETQQDNVQEILTAGNHLLGLINEVLDLAKIESGQMDLLIEKVALDEILEECCKLIMPLAKERRIEITESVMNRGYILKSDPARLKQVFINLLSNAVKYNNENGRITIEAEVINRQRLRILVTDTGNGLSEENISKLFTSFKRLDVINNIEGTGIGLVITKNLVELMDGAIGVESTLGEGSSFWVELPLVELSS